MSHRARKRFGQNFLHDPGIIQRIVATIDPQPDDHIAEIGPGQGAITQQLVDACGSMDVIELDRDLMPLLEEQFAGTKLRIHNADALKFDFCSLTTGDNKLRLVGNLPYNISTPLLFHLLEQADCIRDLHVMLQKEVVDRIVAAPGSKTYGRLSVAVQARCHVQSLFTIGPGAFTPPPKVDSAILRLTPDSERIARIDDPAMLDRILTQAFSQRRKTLRNALKGLVDAPTLENLGIDASARAETITVEAYVLLANRLAEQERES
ncbi:MAG: 16S rRNA (adenine(1518)-N(6)/adenine(1519)-N(6))-dimethyltransferase RsmA [Chromatiales bacterium]